MMMTREDYYAQIADMYVQMYESKDKEIEAEDRRFREYLMRSNDRRFREYLMRRNDDDDKTDLLYRSEKENPEEQALDDGELVETEVATDPIETEHGTVSLVPEAQEEESIPQSKVPIANSEILKSIEPGKLDLGLENEDYVVLNENLEQEWVQKKVKMSFEADGDVERDQKMISDANTCCAHKVFVKMPSKEKHMKHLKAWKFKFKPTSKRSRLMGDMFSFVEETALLKKDPKETIWDCVKEEFKETMAACGKNRVDQFKLVEEKESKPEVLNLKPTCLYHQIGHGEKERLGIKKKRKGFKSWMFKYKRGDKKLHTLIFSNNMRMVVFQQRGLLVYLQMRKAETSSDLLMFNGKYSLPRRAIGSKLDTGEIVLSNQERNELCTENKEEVKSCLDRPQASVLMEEEPDSVRVNEVKLENKQTWTKLKVKKHDNLSWKEDESGSICCILKLGGVAITCKNVLEKIYAENLEIMACRLRPAMMESSVPSKVIGRDGSKRHGRSEIFCEVDAFGNQESSKFQNFAVAFMDISTVAKTQGLGFVHVLHEDAVLDSKLSYLIGNMREEDQKQQGDSELLVIVLECVDAKGGVGMDKKPFHLSLRNHRVWDPGGCISGLSRFC